MSNMLAPILAIADTAKAGHKVEWINPVDLPDNAGAGLRVSVRKPGLLASCTPYSVYAPVADVFWHDDYHIRRAQRLGFLGSTCEHDDAVTVTGSINLTCLADLNWYPRIDITTQDFFELAASKARELKNALNASLH